MTLPEKVRDVTQSEWLSYRERLATAEAQLALAMAWGAEACATLDWLTRDSGVTHSMVGAWLDEGPVALARERQRAERAEAERDALLARLGSPDTHPGIAWQSLNRERDEARERAQVAECEVQSWKDECGRWEERVGEVEARLLAVTAERDAIRKERDALRAALTNAEADLAAARAQLAAVVAAARALLGSAEIALEGPKGRKAWETLYDIVDLADAAQAAREHDGRVRAEERAKVIDEVLRCVDEPTGADRPYQARNIIAARIRALGSRS